MLTSVDVNAIVRQFLGDNLELLSTTLDQPTNLVEYLVHRPTLMLSRYQRNGTVGTMPVTALRNLNISIMAWSSQVTSPPKPSPREGCLVT